MTTASPAPLPTEGATLTGREVDQVERANAREVAETALGFIRRFV